MRVATCLVGALLSFVTASSGDVLLVYPDGHRALPHNPSGGVCCSLYAIISFENCIFCENSAQSGGGLHSIASEGSLRGSSTAAGDDLYCTITDCRFESNSAYDGEAARFWVAYPTFQDCEITGNSGGGIVATYSGLTFTDSNFIANTGSRGALVCDTGFFVFTVVGCCFAQNSPAALLNNDVIPLLCDPEIGDFHLQENSPCAPFSPPNQECDLIGAWPVETMSWGKIKSQFK